jgi:UDP-glucose:(heptosyl)LPS alpha-1,3-glucosyltransferase
MNIALVIERMDPSRGGRETSTAQIAEALAARGHRVTILCQRAAWRAEGVAVVELGRRGLRRVRRLEHFVTDVQSVMTHHHYDIVHTSLPIPGANIYQVRGGTVPAQLAAIGCRWGLIGPLHVAAARLSATRRRMGQLERQVMADPATRVLPVSQLVAEEVAAYYGRRDGVQVVFNAVDVPAVDAETRAHWRQEKRYRMGVDPATPVFLTVATNPGLKGVDHLIVAFARFFHNRPAGSDARLVVIGHHLPEGLIRHASLRDVGPRCLFLPPTEEIFAWYSAADAVALLSWYDACSRVVLEAVRWHLPVLTTSYNGAAEVLTGGAGIEVDSPRDTAAVAAGLAELARPDRRAERADACRAVADSLSMDRHVEELLAAYNEVLKR